MINKLHGTDSNSVHVKSFLFVPSVKENFYTSVLNLDAQEKSDCIIFYLEDSVENSHKNQARVVENKFLAKAVDYRKKLSKSCRLSVRVSEYGSK